MPRPDRGNTAPKTTPPDQHPKDGRKERSTHLSILPSFAPGLARPSPASARRLETWLEDFVPINRPGHGSTSPYVIRAAGPTLYRARELINNHGIRPTLAALNDMFVFAPDYPDGPARRRWREDIISPARYLRWVLRDNPAATKETNQ